jgi:acyl-CoA synthetase (AMP-forming)/AMP-acid ligase II
VSRLIDHLRGHGERVAVLTDTQQLSYRKLADTVADTARKLDGPRRLVLLETRNDLATLVHYLAAMIDGHVVLPVPAECDHTTIVQTYEPDVVIDGAGIHHRHHGGRHRLHDDLALLLSTSASTGSPKLVRLSHRNLASNATAIADYLDIRETDRAATILPMSYCYGLSVVHSLHGHFGDSHREALVLAGFALLIWLTALRCPPAATVVAGLIAEASLYIYLTHYQVYPLFDGHPLLGVIASVVVGVLLTQLVSMLRSRLRGWSGWWSSVASSASSAPIWSTRERPTALR